MKLLNRKKLWKSVLGIILSLAIVLSPIPGSSFTVHAATFAAGDVYVASVNLKNATDHKISISIGADGVNPGTATLTTGSTPVLTLDNFTYNGACGEYNSAAGFGIFCHNGKGTVKIKLIGTNSITINTTKDQQLLGIYSYPNDGTSIEIEGPGSLEIINDSCTRDNYGIYCCGNLIISNATVIAQAGNSSGDWRASTGIRAQGGITINDSTVSGIGGDTKESGYGIYGNLTMSNSTIFASGKYQGFAMYTPEIPVGCNVTAIGSTYAIKGVKNAIPGTGWDNVAGDGTGVDIPINTSASGQDIRTYKKVQFLSHEHSFTYQTGTGANANKIIATCSVEGCTLPESSATLTIAAPTLTTYGQTGTGISADAVITDADGIKGEATVKYYKATKSGSSYTKGDALDAAPTSVGDYVAEITLGTATASVGYTIEKAAEAAPAANTDNLTISYTDETISANDGYEVASDSNGTEIASFSSILDGDTPTVYIRKTASDGNHAPSAWVAVTLASRPVAPTGLTTTNATDGGTTDGKIIGTTAVMEYSADNGTTWTDATASQTLVGPGTYLVRLKADSNTPAGRTVGVTVGSKEIILSDEQKPTAKIDLTYNGTEQDLINTPAEALPEGTTEIRYAIGTDSSTAPTEGWSTSIPKATNAGTYYVWYKVVGDDNHNDTEPVCVTAIISKEEIKPNEPTIERSITYIGEPQELVTAGEVEGGTLMYALGTDDKTAPTEGWSTEIPKGSDVGIYYVWYYAKGDEYHLDSAKACVVVTIYSQESKGSADAVISDPEGSTTSIDISKNPEISDGLKEQAEYLASKEGADVQLKLILTPRGQEKATESTVLENDEKMYYSVTSQYKDDSVVSVDVLSIDIKKIVKNENSENESTITGTDKVLEIGIAYDFTGKYDPVVVRQHGETAEVFKALSSRPAADSYEDASFYADTANNMLYIYSNKFSTYVVAYSTEENNAQNRTTISSGGSSSSSTTASYPTTVPVYRLFNTVTGQHFYTANKQERDLILEKNASDGWTDEGIAFETAQKTGIPVYRVFDLLNGNHIFTTDAAARDLYIANGCRDEGIAWYAPATVGRKVYKLTDAKSNKVTYTISKAEADMLIEAGFTCEDAEFVVY